MSDNIFYVYLLRCWKTKEGFQRHRPLYGNIIYTGQTNNIYRRLIEHTNGKSRYTSQFHGKIRIAYLEHYDTQSEAFIRESEIKTFSRDKKIKMIYNFKESHSDVLEHITTNLRKLL